MMNGLAPAEAGPLVDQFRRYLRDHNLPVTSQRELVAQVIFSSREHLSVDDIERELRERGVHVGKATVYRTLTLLVESGMISEREFGEGFHRYEHMPARSHHEHLICLRCGKVVEFANDRLERMKALIAEEYGFQHHHHHLEIYGTCAECQKLGHHAPEPAAAGETR